MLPRYYLHACQIYYTDKDNENDRNVCISTKKYHTRSHSYHSPKTIRTAGKSTENQPSVKCYKRLQSTTKSFLLDQSVRQMLIKIYSSASVSTARIFQCTRTSGGECWNKIIRKLRNDMLMSVNEAHTPSACASVRIEPVRRRKRGRGDRSRFRRATERFASICISDLCGDRRFVAPSRLVEILSAGLISRPGPAHSLH